MPEPLTATGFVLQDAPPIYVTKLPGHWLLKHTTPSWRIKDPEKGFQRMVKDKRAREVAVTVLDQRRTFPNAIILATTTRSFPYDATGFILPPKAKFLIVDGQHRLRAQKFSEFEASYACIIHMNLDEQAMARLFLEINDTQRRVPSSLRWDLVRLVRPDSSRQDELNVKVADIVYELTVRDESPFFETLDRTGEQPELRIKQGSLAPEIYTLLSKDHKRKDADTEDYVDLLIRYFAAIKSLDPDGWGNPGSRYYKARVLRALVRVLSDVLQTKTTAGLEDLTTRHLANLLSSINPESLSDDAVRTAQGAAGVQHLYEVIRRQVFGTER
jgi:DGQHR domain-containing protein